MCFSRIADQDWPTTVFKTKDFCIVSLDFAQLVHELQLVNPDISGAISRRKLFSVVRNSDASNAVSLIVSLLCIAVRVWGVSLLDVVEVCVDVDCFEEFVGIDVSLVDCICGHVVVEVPDSNGVIGTASDERAWRQNGFLVVARRGVDFEAPDASRMKNERMRLAHLKNEVLR